MKMPVSFFSAIIFVFCFSMTTVAAEKADSSVLAAFRARATGVAGFTEQADRYRFFGVRQLYDIIDGGAVEYEKPGLVNGIVIGFIADSNRTAEIYIENFGTTAHAKSMLAMKKKSASEPKTLGVEGSKNAFYDEVIGGCIVYFYNNKFYFEMTFTGYEKTSRAIADAKAFANRFAVEATGN
jgi:hypothetical protein